jgi:hypothetical protein
MISREGDPRIQVPTQALNVCRCRYEWFLGLEEREDASKNIGIYILFLSKVCSFIAKVQPNSAVRIKITRTLLPRKNTLMDILFLNEIHDGDHEWSLQITL